MTAPFAGLPTEGAGCAFSPDLVQPSCGAPCTTHILSSAEGWGLVTFSSCDRHAPIARAAGRPFSEHAYHADCLTNACIAMPDAEPAAP